LDGKKLRVFSAGQVPTEINYIGSDNLQNIFLNPVSIEFNSDDNILFVADPPKNKIYRLDVNLNDISPYITYTLSIGGLGNENDKFNSPSELSYINDSLFVLDYNNNCVKEFNNDLNWIYTYQIDEFLTDTPTNIAIHPEFKLVYVLCKSKTIYVFDHLGKYNFSSFKLNQISENILKMIFDEAGEFLYFITQNNVYKYSSVGDYVTQLNLPSTTYIGGKSSFNRSLLLFNNTTIIKLQDILEIHKIGQGLPTKYWSMDQLTLDRNEFASDTNYNRALTRITQNIKMFRDSLNAKLVIATEQTSTNVVNYFSIVPISVSDRPVFTTDVENETIGIGVNELHVPQVLNRELSKLYDAVYQLKQFLDIKNFNVQAATNCAGQFCWSWKAMSCYNLTFPALRVCSINPVTYSELENVFTNVSYAPTKTWGEATSTCCSNVVPPV
jgi:hypothetical protein